MNNKHGIPEEVRVKLLQTFKAFIAFCEENNLQYYGECGTCLGAIRHKGFIPWDDDIDVDMPRADYNRLLELRGKLKGTGYEIFNFGDKSNDTGLYSTPYIKFCDSNTTVWERKQNPYLFGIFIDVFPLDEVGDINISRILDDKYRKALYRYSSSVHKWNGKDLWNMVKGLHPKECLSFFYNKFVRSNRKKYYFDRVTELQKEIEEQHGDYYLNYGSSYGFDKSMLSKQIYDKGVKVAFEDFEIVVPEHYTEYLEHIYKDWQTPPPPEQRISHHYVYFEDLNKRWTIDEILRLGIKDTQKNIKYTYE